MLMVRNSYQICGLRFCFSCSDYMGCCVMVSVLVIVSVLFRVSVSVNIVVCMLCWCSSVGNSGVIVSVVIGSVGRMQILCLFGFSEKNISISMIQFSGSRKCVLCCFSWCYYVGSVYGSSSDSGSQFIVMMLRKQVGECRCLGGVVQWCMVCLNRMFCMYLVCCGLLLVWVISIIGISYVSIGSRKVSVFSVQCLVLFLKWVMWCQLCWCVNVKGMSISSVSIFMFLVIMFMLVKKQLIQNQCQDGFSSRWCSRLQLVSVIQFSNSGLICVLCIWQVKWIVISRVSVVSSVLWWFYRWWARLQVSVSVFSVDSSDGSRNVMCQLCVRKYVSVWVYMNIGGLFGYSLWL